MNKWLRYFLFVVILGVVGAGLFVASVNYGVFGHLYTKKELHSFKNETSTRVFSADNELIGKFYAVNRTNVKFDQIPTHVVNALVATEDARYFEHEGVDSRSLLRVLFKTILLNQPSAGGGSTITQQLLKNMYGRANYGPLTMLINKTKEAILATRIEEIYTKEEILALYLNTVPFGENVFGIEAASRLFYNKSISEVSIDEGAVLIGMLKANTYYNPRLYPEHAKDRRNTVLAQMEKYYYLSERTSDSLSTLPIELDFANLASEGPANYFLKEVKKELKTILKNLEEETGKKYNYESDGLVVTTTLNAQMQYMALSSMKQHLSAKQKVLNQQYKQNPYAKHINELVVKELKRIGKYDDRYHKIEYDVFDWNNAVNDSITVSDSVKLSLLTLHAGIIGVSPQTGAIQVYVGGVDFRSHPYNQIRAKRQMASSFKPILYAAALDNGMTPCTYISNTPKVYKNHGDWSPANYDHQTGGKYSITAALMKSKNIPAVNVMDKVGYDEVDYVWRKLGFSSVLENAPSSALGTVTASAQEVAVAYAAFANGGKKITPFTITEIKSAEGQTIYKTKVAVAEEILIPETVGEINYILQRAINEGTGVAMRYTYGVNLPLAGKTGTSQNYADAWFTAYNPNLVMVARVGASKPSVHFSSGLHGSGGRLALPLVALTFKQIQNSGLKNSYNTSFPALDSVQLADYSCPDFEEDNAVDKVLNLFKAKPKNKKKKREKKEDTKEEKKRWRLFKKKKKS